MTTSPGHIERVAVGQAPRLSALATVAGMAPIAHEADVWRSVGLYRHGPNGYRRADGQPFKVTSRTPALAWVVLTYDDQSLRWCWLRTESADGARAQYVGARAVRWWAAQHLPLTLDRALELLRNHPDRNGVQPVPTWWPGREPEPPLDALLSAVSP